MSAASKSATPIRRGRIVVLASGNGSNLAAVLRACADDCLHADVVAVVSDRPDAYALQRAGVAGIPARCVDWRAHRAAGGGRDGFDARVADVVGRFGPDLVVLAGWMRVLGPTYVEALGPRTINLHPALPGAFPGVDAIARAHAAFAAGAIRETGVMVHRLALEVDAGAPIMVETIPLHAGEDLAALEARVHAVEHRLLVAAIDRALPAAIAAVDRQPVALLSVSDKTGLVELASGLHERGYGLVASGGTARALREAELPVRDVSDVTGAPEMLGGRVKTLHPAIHGGILARRDAESVAELARHGIDAIDIVVCNLYPFVETIAGLGADPAGQAADATAIEEIDIGGVTLLRAAAKNFESVTVVPSPAFYPRLLAALDDGGPRRSLRRQLALAAFSATAAYDTAISNWLAEASSFAGDEVGADEAGVDDAGVDDAGVDGAASATTGASTHALPAMLHFALERGTPLRYGENPHQQAAIYLPRGAAPRWHQLGGKELSYNNLVDADAAWTMPQSFRDPAVAIVKHCNPCGLAIGADLPAAFVKALAADPTSAFGSVIAVNRPVDRALVEALGSLFVEALVAPAFDEDALALLRSRKKHARLLRPEADGSVSTRGQLELRAHGAGLLVQTRDPIADDPTRWRVVSQRAPTETEWRELQFAWIAAAHVKSNGIVLTRDGSAVGVGAGQMSRVDSVQVAVRRAGDAAHGAVLGSDAFFPFADGVQAAAAAGVVAVVQPGGSVRDAEVIAAADALGLAMVFTGVRHFRH